MSRLICLDVDGVLARWQRSAFALWGEDPSEVLTRWDRLDPRPWDVFSVTNISKRDGWRAIHDAGAEFWATLGLFPWAHELVEACDAVAPTVLLTAPSKDPSSYAGKAEWIRKHFPRREHIITTSKYRCARPGAVLIDDSPSGCQAFLNAGGDAILFPGTGNDLHRMCDDKRVEYVRCELRRIFEAQ